MDDRVDIWREDGDTGSWMIQRTVCAMGDISADTVAREVCRVQGYGDVYLAPVSERSQTKEYLDE
jgi:predicted PilT family ATPase